MRNCRLIILPLFLQMGDALEQTAASDTRVQTHGLMMDAGRVDANGRPPMGCQRTPVDRQCC